MDEGGNSRERELNYYRRECNDLGARLLRLQEEQSQAFREARRSRTVVKLLREAYRLGDVAATAHDVGGPMLELVVDNALCDRAVLLREEPVGSGRFLMAHAIGLPENGLQSVINIAHPPAFLYSSGQKHGDLVAEQVASVVDLPYVLWAYDRGSGHALVIGNRSESNINRPFEAGDQELIESALSVYLDVLYRKQAEAQLRQAKQVAEAASVARADFLQNLADEVRQPLEIIIDLLETLRMDDQRRLPPSEQNGCINEIVNLSSYAISLVTDAARQTDGPVRTPSLEFEWIPCDDLVRAALRSGYAASVKLDVEIDLSLPRRRVAIYADRMHMQSVIQNLVRNALKSTPTGGSVRVSASRRSDGGLEILVSGRNAAPLVVVYPPADQVLQLAQRQDGDGMWFARSIVEAHSGTLTLESSPFGGAHARVILPARCARDFDLSSDSGH